MTHALVIGPPLRETQRRLEDAGWTVASAIGKRHRVRNVIHDIELDGVRSTADATQVRIANFGQMGRRWRRASRSSPTMATWL